MSQQPIFPGADASGELVTLGVMGGGQLGRMFVHAAQQMGYGTAVLDPDPTSPAGLVSHLHVQAGYQDEPALARMVQCCAAITTEFENVPASALETLGGQRPVAPGAEAVRIAQDRIREKAHFVKCGVTCAPYAAITSSQELAAVPDSLLPGVLKTARLGYDGKGQVRVQNRAQLQKAWDELKSVDCVLEALLPLQAECSVIVARGWDGNLVNFPVQHNVHRDGILAITEVHEENLPSALAKQAVSAAKSIANELNYVGVLCVEFFIIADADGRPALVVNEIAPRPHNSGHYTLDACDQSQFELQVRTLTGLPLTQPRQHSPAIMLNLLGDLWKEGAPPPWDRVLALPGTHLHLYGKLKANAGRKMGHLNVTGPSIQSVRATAAKAAQWLGLAYP